MNSVAANLMIVVVTAGLGITLGLGMRATGSPAKAHKFDEVCAYARRTLESDAAVIRTDAQLADTIIARINTDRIGDGAQHLEWCLDKPFPLMVWAACRDRQCYALILDDLARAIR